LYDLIKILASENLFSILEYLRNHQDSNASKISRDLKIHIVTVQKILDGLAKYGFVDSKIKKGIGRPSKLYRFLGGTFNVDINAMLSDYSKRIQKIREKANDEVQFNFDIENELINALFIGGRRGKKILFDEKEGKFVSLIPPPGSTGKKIEEISEKSGLPILDAVRLSMELVDLEVAEVIE